MTSLVRATALMSFGTVLSRITGLLRLAAVAAALGAVETGRLADTYNLGNTAPNILYELLLGGILTSVFVPVFVELLEKEGKERAWQVVSAFVNVALVTLVGITTLLILAAPWIAKVYALRLEGSEQALQQQTLTFLLRLFFPQIIFYALAAMTSGMLNANKRFGPPMYTPVLNNLLVIGVFVLFHQAYGRVTLGTVTNEQLLLMGLGTTAGIALHALAQLPFLRGLGRYSFGFGVGHPSFRKLGRLSVFVIGYVVANQVGYLIVQWLANGQQGGYSAYVYAFTFFMLPHGLFAVSVITALLPDMSRYAVNEDWTQFKDRLGIGLRATVLLILPAAVGYFVLAEPIVRFLLERGVMTARSTDLVAGVLRVFVVGLAFFSAFQLFLRAFYALQDTRTPFLINCVAVALNLAINVPLFAIFGVKGLAAGHAVAYLFGLTLQARALSKRVGGLDGPRLRRSIGRIGASAAGMGIVVWAVSTAIGRLLPPEGLFEQGIGLLTPITLGLAAYLLLGRALRVEELAFVTRLLTRRGAAT